MGKKRQRDDDDDDEIRQKIRKLQDKLKSNAKRKTRRRIIYSSEEDDPICDEGQRSDGERSRRSSSTCHRSATRDASPSSPRRSCSPTVRESAVQQEPTPATSSAPDPMVQLPVTEEKSDKSLDDDILCLLGEAPTPETKLGENIHKDVASRWQEILSKGMPKEIKEKLLKEYLVPANCDFLVPPALNPEVKAALPDPLIKRDYGLLEKQKQIGKALAALAQATELLITKEVSYQKILKPISDASRLLCDAHFMDTRTRRMFVISSVSNDMKETLIENTRSKFLFGDNVSEKVKAAKTIQRSGDALKGQQKTKFQRSNFVKDNHNKSKANSKNFHQRAASKSDPNRGRSTTMTRTSTYRAQPRRNGRDRSPTPPPRRFLRRPTTRRD